jgi:hypothetical protein
LREYLEDEVGIEIDLVDRREDGVEKGRPQINDSIGSKKGSGVWRLPLEPVILARHVKRQQQQYSPSFTYLFSLFSRFPKPTHRNAHQIYMIVCRLVDV